LPAARREPPRRRPEEAPAPIRPELSGALGDLGVLTLQPVDGERGPRKAGMPEE
jgi:hypothetical protein